MPTVITQRVKRLYVYSNFDETYYKKWHSLVEIGNIAKRYRHILGSQTKIRGYLSRIFNEEYNAINEPRIFSTFNVIRASPMEGASDKANYADGYFINLDALVDELSIPDDYFVEILLTTIFVTAREEKIIFPYETKIYAIKELEAKTVERNETLSRIGSISQSHSYLAELGLKEISEELSNGYSRFEIGDYDGAIKSYRKVVEGFRNYLKPRDEEGKKIFKKLIDNSESRTEEIAGFLSKTFSLLSNFGEHYGTKAFDEEGVFANEIVQSLTEYLIKKFKDTEVKGP